MRNRHITIALVALILLAGLGLVLKYRQEPAYDPTTVSGPVTSSVQDRLEAQRSLFQPLVPDTTSHSSTTARNTVAGLTDGPETDKSGKLVETPTIALTSTPSSGKLLQGNQHRQRATQFKKIDFDGRILANTASRWSCARDTNTGLLWETKLFDAGVSDVEHRYSWYDPQRPNRGVENAGSCYGTRCDTHAYTVEINRLGLCGSRQWRLPTFAELETLLDRDYFNPVINQEIFFHTRGASYWTQTQLDNNPELVMQIDFFNGTSSPVPIYVKLAVRLVSN